MERAHHSGEGQQLGFELLLGDIGTNDLVFDLAIFEKQEQGDGADIVFHRKFAGVVHIEFANLGLSLQIRGNLVEHGAYHFAGAAPVGPKIHEDGQIGIDDFGLEVRVGKF